MSVEENHRNHRSRQRRIDAGELVSNKMYRDRIRWLQANDPTFNLCGVCQRMADRGFSRFAKERTGRMKPVYETSYLQRQVGLRAQTGTKISRPVTQWIARDLAEALYEVLDMDPLIEAGDLLPTLQPRDRRSTVCAWADGCSNASGHGRFGGFCEEHAEVMAGIRDRHFNARGNCLSFGGTRDYHIWGTRYVLRDEELDLVEAML